MEPEEKTPTELRVEFIEDMGFVPWAKGKPAPEWVELLAEDMVDKGWRKP